MAKRTRRAGAAAAASEGVNDVDQLLLAALERGDDSLTTGRYLVTFKEGAAKEGAQALSARGLRTADARDFAFRCRQRAALVGGGDHAVDHAGHLGPQRPHHRGIATRAVRDVDPSHGSIVRWSSGLMQDAVHA